VLKSTIEKDKQEGRWWGKFETQHFSVEALITGRAKEWLEKATGPDHRHASLTLKKKRMEQKKGRGILACRGSGELHRVSAKQGSNGGIAMPVSQSKEQ